MIGRLPSTGFGFWIGEVAAAAVRLEPESFVARMNRVGLLPGCTGKLVANAVGLIGFESWLLARDEVLKQGDRGTTDGVLRVSLEEGDGVRRNFGEVRKHFRGEVAEVAGGVVGVHEHDAIVFSIADEAAGPSEESDVKAADGFVGLAGVGMPPVGDADAVVDNRCSDLKIMAALVGFARVVLFSAHAGCGRPGLRRLGDVGERGSFGADDGKSAAGFGRNGDGCGHPHRRYLLRHSGGWRNEFLYFKRMRDEGAGGFIRKGRRLAANKQGKAEGASGFHHCHFNDIRVTSRQAQSSARG